MKTKEEEILQHSNLGRESFDDDYYSLREKAQDRNIYQRGWDRPIRCTGKTTYPSADSYRENMGNGEETHFGKGPKGYERSDEKLFEEVCEALYRDPTIDASEIEVTVKDRIVTLSGIVNSRWTKIWAEECIDLSLEIKDIRNELRIKYLS